METRRAVSVLAWPGLAWPGLASGSASGQSYYSVDRELILTRLGLPASTRHNQYMGHSRGLPLVGCLDIRYDEARQSRAESYLINGVSSPRP